MREQLQRTVRVKCYQTSTRGHDESTSRNPPYMGMEICEKRRKGCVEMCGGTVSSVSGGRTKHLLIKVFAMSCIVPLLLMHQDSHLNHCHILMRDHSVRLVNRLQSLYLECFHTNSHSHAHAFYAVLNIRFCNLQARLYLWLLADYNQI